MTQNGTRSTTTTMKAAQCKDFGAIHDVVSVQDNVVVPSLSDEYKPTLYIHPLMQLATRADRKTHMVIKTLAVALAPGDARVLSGKTRELQGPPCLPYIPGADCCGIVHETLPDETYFEKGDLVMVRFSNAPRDAIAEYARVSTTVCEKVVDSGRAGLSPVALAALASASPAVILADYIRPKERVLILGAGGGIGSHVCQLIRTKASFVCGVASRDNAQRLLKAPLHYDKAIDYTTQNVFELEEFQKEPFDTIIDLACGGWFTLLECSDKKMPPIVKSASQGGRFITPTADVPSFEIHSLATAISTLMVKPMVRSWWSRIVTRRRLPAFINANNCIPNHRKVLTRTRDLAYSKELQAVVDGPYPMTTEGVQKAFTVLESRHPKGKVVIQVAEP